MIKLNIPAPTRRPLLSDILPCAALFLVARSDVMAYHPFAVAAFAAWFDPSAAYMGIVLICAGLISSGAGGLMTKYLSAALIVTIYFSLCKKRTLRKDSLWCSASVLTGGLIYELSSAFVSKMPFSPTIFIGILTEAIGSGIIYILFKRAGEFIPSAQKRTRAAKDEILSAAAIIGVCISGLNGINLPLGTSLAGGAAVYAIICISYSCPAVLSGSAGLGVGYICSISDSGAIAAAGFFGLCAIFGSLLKEFGKFGTAVGFLGAAAAALMYSHFGVPLNVHASDVVLGAGAFILTPEKILLRLGMLLSRSVMNTSPNEGDRLRMYVSVRIRSMAEAFSDLSQSFTELSNIRLENTLAASTDIFEDAARRVCRDCPMAYECWEREFNLTYQRFLSVLSAIESAEDVKAGKCIRGTALVSEMEHAYEKMRIKEIFKGEAKRSRDIAAEQYRGFSKILEAAADMAGDEAGFKSEYEDNLAAELDKEEIPVFELSVLRRRENCFEVYIGLCGGAYVEKLEETASRVTDTKMECVGETDGVVKLISRPTYTVKGGMCSAACESGAVCGDSAEIFDTDDNRTFVVISDGMGCGQNAGQESGCIVRLLKRFVNAGFDAETAIKTINSSLCLQSDRERAAAVDMLCIDRATGIARLFKIGSAETFFIHDGNTEVIFPISFPVGILNDIDLKPQTVRMHDGDVMVMVTDGITQAGGERLKNIIMKEIDKSADPAAIAGAIIKAAAKCQRGNSDNETADDMTCAVIQIERI